MRVRPAEVEALHKFMDELMTFVSEVCTMYLPLFSSLTGKKEKPYKHGSLAFDPSNPMGVSICGAFVKKDNIRSFVAVLRNFKEIAKDMREILETIKGDVEARLKKLEEFENAISQ